MLQKTGTYTGSGTDDRGITGIGFQPHFVIIKGDVSQEGVARLVGMPNTYELVLRAGASPWHANCIKSLDADGFTLGTGARVNQPGMDYYYVAFRADGGGDFIYGTYTGDGNDDRDIAITGMTNPEYAIVMGNDLVTSEAIWYHKDAPWGDASSPFNDTAAAANMVQALGANSFQIGTHPCVNAAGKTYYYVLFKSNGTNVRVDSFVGDGNDDRDITGIGFSPDYVLLAQDGSRAIHRVSAFPAGDNSLYFTRHGFLGNKIQDLITDGFQVGSDYRANCLFEVMMFLATKDQAPTQGRQIHDRIHRLFD